MILIKESGIDVKDMIKVAHEVALGINKLIIDYNEQYLMGRCGYSSKYNRTDFKEEIVMESIMFLDVKKTYAYKMLAKEAHLDINDNLVKGSILDEPKICPTSNLGVKTDSIVMTKDILTLLLETCLDKNIKPKDRMKRMIEAITKLHNNFLGCIDNLDLIDICKPAKWGKNKQFIFGMKAYNSMIENVFEYMSSGKFVNCVFKDMNKLKELNLDFDYEKLNGIVIPYNYDKNKLRKTFKEYNFEIDVKTQWSKIMSTTVTRVIDLCKLMENKIK